MQSSGIELILGTRVKSADVRRKTLLTATGETISYKYLIVATGARVLKLFCFYILVVLCSNNTLVLSFCTEIEWKWNYGRHFHNTFLVKPLIFWHNAGYCAWPSIGVYLV